MADRQNHASGHSLPPCSELLRDFIKCRVPDCNQVFPSAGQRTRHEQVCDVAMERNLSSLAYRPAQFPVQPFRIDTNSAANNIDTNFAANNIDTDSDDSPVFTPDNSRAPSLDPSEQRSQSGAIRTAPHRYRGSSSTPETERRQSRSSTHQPKKLKKQEKEKQNREQHALVLSRGEDFFRNYCGWERREQSGGNGNGAGLYANKNTIMRGAEDLLNFFIHREYCQGLRDGTLRERQARMCEILDGASSRPPYAGTFLEPGPREPVCRHEDSKAKECLVHGTKDWRECRRVHVDDRFARNRDAFVEAMGRGRGSDRGVSSSTTTTQRRGFAGR